MRPLVHAAAVMLISAPAAAQTSATPPALSETEEIALAQSAAPSSVSAEATVLVLKANKYETARPGSNGVTCMVSRSLPLSLEPICYDPEASRTILPMEIERVELRLSGVAPDEIDRHIAESIGSGAFVLPQRPAMAYMMSAGQILYSDAETKVGAFRPHLHIYMPYATAEQFGGFGGSAGTMFDEGEPTANLIVFLSEFVQPESDAGPTGR